MKANTIKLSESQFKKIIKNIVKEELENEEFDCSQKEMIIDALTKCAQAHNVEPQTELEEGNDQFFVMETNPALLSDIYTIAEAFYGTHDMVEEDSFWGTITVYLDEEPFLDVIDRNKLATALPSGTKLC